MNLLSKDELQRLIATSDELCLSIYMPRHHADATMQQGPLRLKHMLAKAKEKLVDYGLRAPEVKRLLAPVDGLRWDWSFWQGQNNGLAIFVIPGRAYHYALPYEFEELVMIGAHFHLKPLLPLLSGNGYFYILALSQNKVRLFQGTRYTVSPVDLDTRPGRRPQDAIYHGQGVNDRLAKEMLQPYFRQIAHDLQTLLHEERAPLVLAGVDDLLPIYQGVNPYSYLIEEGISGDPVRLSPEELHQKSWQIVEPYFLQAQQEAAAQYQRLAQTRRASADIAEIVSAAHAGHIETLFVAVGQYQWGEFDPATNSLQLHAEPKSGDQDLVDTAALQTLLKGGQVYTVEPEKMPGAVPLAAVFRYW